MKKIETIIIKTVLFILLINQCCLGSIITVNPDPNAGANFTSIQNAISSAKHYDTIQVSPGFYSEHINYLGRLISITSTDPNDPNIIANTIIDGDGTGNIVSFSNAESSNCVLKGITIQNGEVGILCNGVNTAPTIKKCVIINNKDGIRCNNGSYPDISYSQILNNTQYGINAGGGSLENCRISGNSKANIYNREGIIKNCVISNCLNGTGLIFDGFNAYTAISNCTIIGNYGHGISYNINTGKICLEIKNCIISLNMQYGIYHKYGNQSIISNYNNIWGNVLGSFKTDYNSWALGSNDISQNPFFYEDGYWLDNIWHEGDYHLMSSLGTWDPVSKEWSILGIDSICIDKGDPNDSYNNELYPNGGRINIGAYGNTPEASKSKGVQPYCVKYPEMDFNKDCMVDIFDYLIFYDHWLECNLDPNSECNCVEAITQ